MGNIYKILILNELQINEITRIYSEWGEPFVFNILVWYVEYGEANGDEASDASHIEREIGSIDDLIEYGETLRIRGRDSVRGQAAEAMGAVLWQVPKLAERIWEILTRRIEHEPLVSVRCCLMRPLIPLFKHDRLRCAQFVERLIEEGPSETPYRPSLHSQASIYCPFSCIRCPMWGNGC